MSMKIGIVAPVNPCALSNYLDEEYKNFLQNINVSASSVNNIVKSLLDSGHEVWVFTIGIKSEQIEGRNIHIIIIAGAKWNRIFPNLRQLSRKIKNAIDKYVGGLDVLHAHWCYEYALAVVGYSESKPVFCTIRDWAPVIYSQISIKDRLRNILFKGYWRYKMGIFREVLAVSTVNFIANSEYTASLFKKTYPNRRIEIIHNSIEDEIIVDKPIQHENNFISIAMSLDDGRKNIKTLIEAFSSFCRHYDNYKLVLVGNYHRNGGIYEYANKSGVIDKIVFTGVKSRQEIIKLLDESFCMVHPAYEETFGNILIEAMARGTIVIGGKSSGAVPYVLNQGKSGLLCDVSDWRDVANKMLIAVDDKNTVELLVRRALEEVKSLSNTVVGKKQIEVYSTKLYEKEFVES